MSRKEGPVLFVSECISNVFPDFRLDRYQSFFYKFDNQLLVHYCQENHLF